MDRVFPIMEKELILNFYASICMENLLVILAEFVFGSNWRESKIELSPSSKIQNKFMFVAASSVSESHYFSSLTFSDGGVGHLRLGLLQTIKLHAILHAIPGLELMWVPSI